MGGGGVSAENKMAADLKEEWRKRGRKKTTLKHITRQRNVEKSNRINSSQSGWIIHVVYTKEGEEKGNKSSIFHLGEK